jgi:hypothetical protein
MNNTATHPVRAYPRMHLLANASVEVELLAPTDGAEVAAFVQKLPTHDLLFVRRDLTHPKVVTAWLDAVAEGSITSLAARCDGELIGCTPSSPIRAPGRATWPSCA